MSKLSSAHGTRRELLRGVFGAAAILVPRPAWAFTEECPETEDSGSGPNYKTGAPERAVFVEKEMSGRRLAVFGRVVGADCRPIPGAVLDIWQANDQGHYDLEGFKLRGRLATDKSANYRLETILPGRYGPPAHIHVKVSAPGSPLLTTQFYFAGYSFRDGEKAHPTLIAKLEDGPGGKKISNFNFVLKKL